MQQHHLLDGFSLILSIWLYTAAGCKRVYRRYSRDALQQERNIKLYICAILYVLLIIIPFILLNIF